jgi:predicted nucleic acid-binding Zn ribbon protein
MANQGKIKCTFLDCFQYFSSEKQMKSHKKYSQVHDHCPVCDLDFPDWDTWSAHNALYSGRDAKGKHIKEYIKAGDSLPKGNKLHQFGCAKCGELFKTESGRQRHTDGVS